MTDHAPFLHAICARPEDDGPRLIYADWLDENGECERAEFIRVQCELARGRKFVPQDALVEIAESGRLYSGSAQKMLRELSDKYDAETDQLPPGAGVAAATARFSDSSRREREQHCDWMASRVSSRLRRRNHLLLVRLAASRRRDPGRDSDQEGEADDGVGQSFVCKRWWSSLDVRHLARCRVRVAALHRWLRQRESDWTISASSKCSRLNWSYLNRPHTTHSGQRIAHQSSGSVSAFARARSCRRVIRQ
jgi:uncharacterized protein (TIGR02996 family)